MIAATQPGVSEAEIYAAIMHTINRWGLRRPLPVPVVAVGAGQYRLGSRRAGLLRAEPPRIVARGDVVQAEIIPAMAARKPKYRCL